MIIKIILPFGLFILSLYGCTSQKYITGDRKIKQLILESTLTNEHFIGINVWDAENQTTIVSCQSDNLFTPASNTKLLTFLITDKILKDSLPTLRYCIQNDSLYFSGMGDPTFLHPKFQPQKAFEFISKFQGNLVFVPQKMEDQRFGPGWAWDDYPYYFQPEKGTFPIYGNCIWITKDSIEDTYSITPKGFDVNVFPSDDTLFKSRIIRPEFSNEFELKYSKQKDRLEVEIPFLTSDSMALKLLEDTLERKVHMGAMPANCDIKYLHNFPKDSLFKRLLVDSDNLFAEQLLLSSSFQQLGMFDSDSLIKYSMHTFFPDWQQKIKWKDGSGLSRYNLMSPDFIMEVLRRIYKYNSWERIAHLFPDGGTEGTLKNILKSDVAFVHAKSGSMTGVYNLSGFIKADSGNILLFSIMNNNFNKPVKEIRKEVEKIVLFLKSEY